MKFLSLDTSSAYSVVALCDEHGLIYGQRRLFEKGRTDGLIDLIAHCLDKARLRLEKIDCFAVGVGPGSFTGLRIGISAVKGFGYAGDRPCFTFSSLDAIAFNRLPSKMTRLCVMVDARRSNVYCRFYTLSPALRRASADMLVDVKTLEKKLMSERREDTPMAFSGDGIRLYKEDLFKDGGVFSPVPEKFWYPTPESIAALAQEQIRKNKPVDCFTMSAVYLYEQDCQVTKQCA